MTTARPTTQERQASGTPAATLRPIRGTPLFELAGIAKRYGSTQALRGANLRLFPGRVHALLGENGAGKSTLIKIAVGALARDSGWISLDGQPVAFASVRNAIRAGIIPIYQHLSLFPQLSVLDNLSSFRLAEGGAIRAVRAQVDAGQARAWLDSVGLDVDLATPIGGLGLAERQMVEIARGIGQDCKVLVLDEPTAALGHEEAERLFTVIRRLCAAGTAVLFISHKLDEIETLADDVSVLSDGRSAIDCQPARDLGRGDLIAAMLGEGRTFASRSLPDRTDAVLEARQVSGPGIQPFDLTIGGHEIVGLTGLVGAGANEIAALLAGAMPASAGSIDLRGASIGRTGGRIAVEAGIGFIPADRQTEGLFLPHAALHNASAAALPRLTLFGRLARRLERALIEPLLARLALHPLAPDRAASGFSGGNQQKLLVARCLAIPNLALLVALEPTRGVDVGARETIHDAIVEAARGGIAVILASSDLEEILALSHRILVVCQGKITATFERGARRSDVVAALAGGGTA